VTHVLSLGLPPIPGIGEYKHLKFGTYVDYGKYKPRKEKLSLSGGVVRVM